MRKTAVVTGASSGIGRAVASALAVDGYQVVNVDLQASEKRKHIDYFRCDITKGEEIDRLYSFVKEKYGVPDVLISNAGQGIHEKLSEGDPEKWKNIIDVNLMGTLRFIRAFIPEMLIRKKGDVFFMSSISSKNPYEYGGVYSATKAAVDMIAKTLQLETKGLLRVFLISPGVVDTSFFDNMIGSNHGVDDIGLGSLSPVDLAEVVLYLLKLPKNVHVPEITLTPPKQT